MVTESPVVKDTKKSSIMIYKYETEIQHTYLDIQEKIENTISHQYEIRKKKDEPTQRYVTYEFSRRETTKDILWYAIKSERELPEEERPQVTYHDIYISKKGYLVIAGLTDRNTLLKYLAMLLHSGMYNFTSRHLNKSEIQEITAKILAEDPKNIIYAPRFRFFERYKGREFSDFRRSEIESAEDDREYPEMLEKCQYFEPIFNIQKIIWDEVDPGSRIELYQRGLIRSSHRRFFTDWIEFVNKYVPWGL